MSESIIPDCTQSLLSLEVAREENQDAIVLEPMEAAFHDDSLSVGECELLLDHSAAQHNSSETVSFTSLSVDDGDQLGDGNSRKVVQDNLSNVQLSKCAENTGELR